tara:strand:- start:4 stop:234 length:231 start_codon:yes stop_codon:yes gene_type:complete
VALNIAYFSMKSHEIPKIWAKKAVIFQKFGHLNPSHPFPYYMTVTTPCEVTGILETIIIKNQSKNISNARCYFSNF